MTTTQARAPELPDGDDAATPAVCIFAPSPLYTVTFEASADGAEVHFHAGGQGVWVARMVRTLGARPRLCAAFGGEPGAILPVLLAREAIEVSAVECHRANGGYIHDRREGERDPLIDLPSPPLTRHELDDLYGVTIAEGMRAGVAVLTGASHPGVVPADSFRRLATDLAANGVQVVADISGEDLRALTGGVHVLKVSHDDLLRDGFVGDRSAGELARAIAALRGIAETIVITRAEEPALALVGDDVVEIVAPQFDPIDHRGAGDSMTAAIAAGLAFGLPVEHCLRLGAAAGAQAVTRHGLGSGRLETVHEIAEHVTIRHAPRYAPQVSGA